MKTKLSLFLIPFLSLIIFIIPSTVLSQWIDHGDYKEIKVSKYEINQLVMPKNDKYFYVTDTSGKYMIFDYDGKLYFSKSLYKLDTLNKYYFITSDGKVQIYYKMWDPMNGETRQTDVQITCIQISNDSIVDYFENSGYASVRSPNNSTFGATFMDYNLKRRLFLFTYYSSGERYSGGWGTHTNWHNREDIADIDENYDHFIHIEENYSGYYDPSYSSSRGSASINYVSNMQNKTFLIDTDYYNSEKPGTSLNGFIPQDARLSNDTNMFIGIDNQTVYFYKFYNNNFHITDTMLLDHDPYQIEFSINGKYLIVKNSNYCIYFYDVSLKTLVDSLVPTDTFKTYSFRVINDSLGLIVTDYNTIRYYKPAVFSNTLLARFKIPKLKYATNDTVCFINISIGEPDKFLWEFGDGEMSHEKFPKYVYSYPGTYYVKLTIAKGDKIERITSKYPIEITRKPKANFEVDTTIGFAPFTIHLTDKSFGKITERFWNFGDGDSLNKELNPIHTYTLPGVYPIRLVVENDMYSDTLLKWDYIIVKQTPITDTAIVKDEIDWKNNRNINEISSFEGLDKDYYIETSYTNYKSIHKLKEDFKHVWTQDFFKCKLDSKMKKSDNGNIYLIGDISKNDTSYCIYKIESDNNLNKIVNISLHPYYQNIDFVPLSSDLIVFTNSDSLDNYGYLKPNLKQFYYRPSDSLLNISYTYNSSMPYWKSGSWYNATLKSDVYNNNISVFVSGKILDNRMKGSYTYQFYYNSINSKNYISNIQDNGYVIKHIFVNDSCTITFFWDSRISLQKLSLKSAYDNQIGWQNERHWSKKIDGTVIKDAIRLTDTSFVISGAKSKHCWYVIMDTSGKILEEHEIKNRFGTFKSISVNSDGSLILFGSLYKHSYDLIKTNEYQDTNMIQQNQAGLIICKTKQYLKNTPNNIQQSFLFENDDKFKVSPNPAYDLIEISVGYEQAEPIQSEIRIYNVLGEIQTTPSLHDIPRYSGGETIRIDVSGLAPGMYFVRIGDKVSKFVKI